MNSVKIIISSISGLLTSESKTTVVNLQMK